jgi:hypothetical protein
MYRQKKKKKKKKNTLGRKQGHNHWGHCTGSIVLAI